MPWVRLHGLKDYYDMAAVLDEFPRIRMNFNLVPSLVEQIRDYAQTDVLDEHLRLTQKPAAELSDADKEKVLAEFFNCNPENMIRPHPRFYELSRRRGEGPGGPKAKIRDFDVQDYLDLQVWSNLAWVDPIFKSDPLISGLLNKERGFSEEDKHKLIEKQREILGRILPKHKELQDKGQIEVSFSPYFHPILPLICDTDVARFALPQLPLPQVRFAHPEDARVQIERGAEMYGEIFGREPKGMWPSEGSVSEEMVSLAAQAGVKWIATDEEILFQSFGFKAERPGKAASLDRRSLYRPYQVEVDQKSVRVVFRDHTLSDLIGFVYSSWKPADAAADLIDRLHKIRESIPPESVSTSLVSIILDGENCWEYYKNDGHDFLHALYSELSQDDLIHTTTMSDFLENATGVEKLPHLFPGSWINHNFRVWIGHPEDNLSWDVLKKTRDALASFQKEQGDRADLGDILREAWRELYIAEGSDWNWWYGDEHQGPGTEQFDRLYRSHLLRVYELIDQEPPEELYHPIKSQFVSTYLFPPTGYLRPIIDGEKTHYYEWQQAGFFDPEKAGGTMHQASSLISGIYFGSNRDTVFFRIDPGLERKALEEEGYQLVLEILEPPRYRIVIKDDQAELSRRVRGNQWKPVSPRLEFAFVKIMELAIPMNLLAIDGQKGIWFRLVGERQGQQMGKWPAVDVIKFELPHQKGTPIFWEV